MGGGYYNPYGRTVSIRGGTSQMLGFCLTFEGSGFGGLGFLRGGGGVHRLWAFGELF